MSSATRWQVRRATVEVHPDRAHLGRAAGMRGAALLRETLRCQERARIIVACAPSQEATLATLALALNLDWARVDVFHMDEYVGLPQTHPASFRRWLREHLIEIVQPGSVHYLNGDAGDLGVECTRYAALLAQASIDVCFLGVGENGHIAFNDPHVADFDDPYAVKIVTLDARCRAQQVGEGHFPNLAAVPEHALTLTCPTLLGAQHLICSVPGRPKAEAVRDMLEGPRSTACPASAICDHPHAAVFLDQPAAALLSGAAR